MFEIVYLGFFLSLGLILPLGIQNLFIFHQGIAHKKITGALPAFLTASICDTILIVLSVSVGSAMTEKFPSLINIFFLLGIFYIIFIGFKLWNKKTKLRNSNTKLEWKQQITTSLVVSIVNPHAWLDTFGVLGTQALQLAPTEKFLFATICIIVSWIWFFTLIILGRMVRVWGTDKFLFSLNKVSAIILWAMAIKLLIPLFYNN